MFTPLLAHIHTHAVALIWSPITSRHWHVARLIGQNLLRLATYGRRVES